MPEGEKANKGKEPTKKEASLAQREKETEEFKDMKTREIERQRKWEEEVNALKRRELERQRIWEEKLLLPFLLPF